MAFSRYPSWLRRRFRSSRSRSSKCLRYFLVSNRSPSFVDPLDADAGTLAVERPFLRGISSRRAGHDLLGQHLIAQETLVTRRRGFQARTQLPVQPNPIG